MGQKIKALKNKRNDRDWGLLLLVLGLFLFVAALFLEGRRGTKDQASYGADPVRAEERRRREALNQVEQNLKEAHLKEATRVHMTEIENDIAAPVVPYGTTPIMDDGQPHPLVFDQENPGRRVLEDVEPRRPRRSLTPDQRITSKIERESWSRDYNKKYEQEYVRQFLENARRKGVEIRLNENLDVTGIETFPVEEPIRVPQSLPRSAR